LIDEAESLPHEAGKMIHGLLDSLKGKQEKLKTDN
jgi:hypothetical protein